MRKTLGRGASVATYPKTNPIEREKKEAGRGVEKRIGITIGTTCTTCTGPVVWPPPEIDSPDSPDSLTHPSTKGDDTDTDTGPNGQGWIEP